MNYEKTISVSALVPVFNQEKYLPEFFLHFRLLKSTQLEVLFSDNRSTDRSREIIRDNLSNLRALKAELIEQDINLGVVKNGEFLWGKCATDYAFYAHSDDRYGPEFVGSCMRGFQDNPETILSMCQCEFMDEQGRPYSREPKDRVLFDSRQMSRGTSLQYFMYGTTGLFIYGIFNKKKIDQLGIPLTQLSHHPFWEYPLILACFLNGPVAAVTETEFTYRLHIHAAADSPHVDTHLTGPPVVTDGKPLHAHAARFIVRFWEIVDLYSPRGSWGKVLDKFWLLLGAWRSEGGSVNWYWRVKESLWRDLWTFAKRSEWKEFLILASFIPLKIRILRLLIKQRVF
jgi:glycosyltransferase involved in cell wall biosynthesis